MCLPFLHKYKVHTDFYLSKITLTLHVKECIKCNKIIYYKYFVNDDGFNKIKISNYEAIYIMRIIGFGITPRFTKGNKYFDPYYIKLQVGNNENRVMR